MAVTSQPPHMMSLEDPCVSSYRNVVYLLYHCSTPGLDLLREYIFSFARANSIPPTVSRVEIAICRLSSEIADPAALLSAARIFAVLFPSGD